MALANQATRSLQHLHARKPEKCAVFKIQTHSYGSSYKRKSLKKSKKAALESISELFLKAHDSFRQSPELANKYVKLARKVGMKNKVKMPRELKRRYCKHCNSYLMPSVNCRVRLTGQKVVYYCLSCKKYMRFPYVREKKEKRKKKNLPK